MKRSKLFAITLQSKTRLIFFSVAVVYNLLLGLYLKDFFVLSPMLVTLYLLSALPTLFFVLKIRSTPMRAIVLIVLFSVMVMSIVSALSCRRLLPTLTFVVTAIEMMYLGIFDNGSGKDKLLTKICVLVLTVFIIVWNVDITNDITSTANGRTLYGFHKLETVSAPDADFYITKIY